MHTKNEMEFQCLFGSTTIPFQLAELRSSGSIESLKSMEQPFWQKLRAQSCFFRQMSYWRVHDLGRRTKGIAWSRKRTRLENQGKRRSSLCFPTRVNSTFAQVCLRASSKRLARPPDLPQHSFDAVIQFQLTIYDPSNLFTRGVRFDGQ